MRTPTLLFPLILVLTAIGPALPAQAHFAMTPKLELGPEAIEAPATPFIETADLELSRADFLDHLARLTALDTKYDRMQPGFWFPFELVRGIAFFHPENVHEVIDRLGRVSAGDRKALLIQWFGAQAEVFLGFNHLARTDLADDVVMEVYAAGAKAEFLEELVVLGSMEPTVAGLEAFLAPLTPAERRQIDTGIETSGDEVTPAEEQQAMRERWRRFRRDAVGSAEIERACATIEALDAAADTPVLRVGERTLVFGDMLKLFGTPKTDRQWVAVRKLSCSRAAMLLALGDLADALGLVPARVEHKITTSRALYAAARGLMEVIEPGSTLAVVQRISRYPNVVMARDQFLDEVKSAFASAPAQLDEAFLLETPWFLERTMAPQHSIHF